MYTGRTLFSQVMDFISWTSFDRIVAKYRGDVGVRTLRCTEHFRVMAFAQITYRESLRDIEANSVIFPAVPIIDADSGDCGQGFRLIADSDSDRSRTAFR